MPEPSKSVQLARPGSMTENDIMTLRRCTETDLIMFDVWAGNEHVRAEMLEVVLSFLPGPSVLVQ